MLYVFKEGVLKFVMDNLSEDDISSIDDLLTAVSLMEELNIEGNPTTLEVAKALLRRSINKKETHSSNFNFNIDSSQIRKRFKDLCEELRFLISTSDIMTGILPYVRVFDSMSLHIEKDQKKPESIIEYLTYLEEQIDLYECPIIVPGNVSAGKSSLINMILDSNLLPAHTNHMTSTLCVLHSDKDIKKVVIEHEISDNGANVCTEKEFHDASGPHDVNEYLKDVMQSGQDFHQIDIYWPFERLPKSVAIMDTPALNLHGHVEQMNKASAIICVFNAALAESMDEIKNYFGSKGVAGAMSMLLKPPLFIFNKWDLVKEEARNDYRNKALFLLNNHVLKIFKNVSICDIEKNVFFMSVKQIMEMQESGIFEDFNNFQLRLRDLYYESHVNRCAKLTRMLCGVAEHLYQKSSAFSLLDNSRENIDIKKLQKTISLLGDAKKRLLNEIHCEEDKIKKDIIEKLYVSLNSQWFEEVGNWFVAPNCESHEEIELTARVNFQALMMSHLSDELLKIGMDTFRRTDKKIDLILSTHCVYGIPVDGGGIYVLDFLSDLLANVQIYDLIKRLFEDYCKINVFHLKIDDRQTTSNKLNIVQNLFRKYMALYCTKEWITDLKVADEFYKNVLIVLTEYMAVFRISSYIDMYNDFLDQIMSVSREKLDKENQFLNELNGLIERIREFSINLLNHKSTDIQAVE